MKAIVIGCVTTVKIDSVVSQIKQTQNQDVPFIGPLDLVVIMDKKVIPVYQNMKFNIFTFNVLESMRVNYRYIDNGRVVEISKQDLLPIDAIGELILTEIKEEFKQDEEDEFTELHKMLSEYHNEAIASKKEIADSSKDTSIPTTEGKLEFK